MNKRPRKRRTGREHPWNHFDGSKASHKKFEDLTLEGRSNLSKTEGRPVSFVAIRLAETDRAVPSKKITAIQGKRVIGMALFT